MNYARETDDRVRGWFNGWIRWEKRHKHGRQLAVGLGAYRNTPEDLLAQIARVRTADGRGRADGVSLFSYAVPRLPPQVAPGSDLPAVVDVAAIGPGRLAFLKDGIGNGPGPFARPARVPPMPWIERPERGWIAGTVNAPAPGRADGLTVKARRTGFSLFRRTKRAQADGSGYFAFTNLKPGRYRLWVDEGANEREPVEVVVEAGKVSRAAP